jgi:hypothetical protein
MAPDLTHDGRFVRGVDENLHPELYAVWGLRDRNRRLNYLMEPYHASMTLARTKDDRLALFNDAEFFPTVDADMGHTLCHLEPLPVRAPCVHCDVASSEAAASALLEHPDARKPENIYKTYVLPNREVRFGVGVYDWSGDRAQLSVAWVNNFRYLTHGALPLPARLALEYSWSPLRQAVPVNFGSFTQLASSRSTMFAGPRFEFPVTHTQGFYFGLMPEWVNIATRAEGNSLVPTGDYWKYNGLTYHTGYVLELPRAHMGNITNHIGVEIRNSPVYPVLFEWRVSFGFFRNRGRHDFGARPEDRNPYE